jgi:molybdate transport system substrate-binding protein
MLALMMALSMTACGANPAASSSQEPFSEAASSAAVSSKTPSSEAAPAEQVELMVSAAASLTDCMNEIKGLYEKENDGITITYNFAASGALQQQIEQGAPADVFFSAGKKTDAGSFRRGTHG